jgi:hypothetical protein
MKNTIGSPLKLTFMVLSFGLMASVSACGVGANNGAPQNGPPPAPPAALNASSAPNTLEASPTISVTITNQGSAPVVVHFTGSGFSPSATMFVGAWNGTNWNATPAYPASNGSGSISGSFNICGSPTETVYGYDFVTGTFSNAVPENVVLECAF